MLTNSDPLKCQGELNRMRREAKHSSVSQSQMAEERDVALSDYTRLRAEKESLREKLQVSFWSAIAGSEVAYREGCVCVCLFSSCWSCLVSDSPERALKGLSELSLHTRF